MEQWLICLAVRGNCHRREYTAILSGFPELTSSSAIPQNLFNKIRRVLPKTGLNPFCISQHSCETTMSSSYYKKGKWSEKAEEKEGQIAYMKNRNTTATCAKAVAGEPGSETDLCYFWLFSWVSAGTQGPVRLSPVPVMAF